MIINCPLSSSHAFMFLLPFALSPLSPPTMLNISNDNEPVPVYKRNTSYYTHLELYLLKTAFTLSLSG